MNNITGTFGGGGTKKAVFPQAKEALNRMKFDVATQHGINLKDGYNGDLTSREAGIVGGYMVKKMIEQVERQMSGQ